MRAIGRVLAAGFLLACLWPERACALSDEIQVYDASIAAPGIVNLTWHNNYTASGARTPEFPGGLVADHALSGVTEWAYGVTDWFEAGLYLPLYGVSRNAGATLNGFKVRALFVAPDAGDRQFFYGINFEFSYNARHWDSERFTSEIRPILGWHLGKVDLVFNPILDNSYKGFSGLDFAPSTRLAYHLTANWAVAAEEYDDFGPLRRFLPAGEQSHQLFAVVDYSGWPLDAEAGMGFGMTQASDKLVFKLILSRDLN
jgi:hypothetical protein